MTELSIRESTVSRATLLDRTVYNLREAWRDMADTLNGALDEIQKHLTSAADRATARVR